MTEIAAKKTILLAFPPGTPLHLCIFLTDPTGKDPARAVLVNISTYRLPTQDTTVILNAEDHSFIKHESIVAFDYAKIIRVDVVQKIIDDNKIEFKEDITDELYSKIITGLLNSRRTPVDVKKFCRKHALKIE